MWLGGPTGGRLLLKYIVMMPVSSSSKYIADSSENSLLIVQPRLTGSCQPKSLCLFVRRETQRSPGSPQPPGRGSGSGPVLRNIWCPSGEKLLAPSCRLLTALIRDTLLWVSKLTGVCQG